MEKPLKPENLKANLKHQLGMIRWYLDREQTIQAATLAREWMVSVLVVHFGKELLARQDREEIENALKNAAALSRSSHRTVTLGQTDALYAELPQADELTALWSKLTLVRNDLAHAGMRENAQPAIKLKTKVEDYFQELTALAEIFLT